MQPRTAAIVGATGLVGGHVLDTLLSDARHSRVVALVRRRVLAEHPSLVQVEVDFRRLDLVDESATDLYCCLGTTIRKAGSRDAFREVDLQFPLNFARWGMARGAKRFMLVSSVDAGNKSNFSVFCKYGSMGQEVTSFPYAKLREVEEWSCQCMNVWFQFSVQSVCRCHV